MSKRNKRFKKWRKRLNKMHLDKHHRKPSSLGGDNSEENISHVPIIQHQAWHILFSNHSPHTIAHIINDKWLDPEFELVVRRRNGQ